MTEEQARRRILAEVRAYCDAYHAPTDEFEPGDRIGYAGRVYDHAEMENLVDAALEFWLTAGRYTDRLERALGEYLGVAHVSFVNSGSSANLAAFAALTAPELGPRAIRPGDEVITVACGFPTTVAPIVQFGAVPVFVDVQIPSYNVDTSQLDAALSERTKAIVLAHTLGNPFDVEAVGRLCRERGLWLVEDNCDALGSSCLVDGTWRHTGTFGDIATSSFYPPHHMTTGEGGAVYTNDPGLARIVRSMRDWGRDCACPSGRDNCCGHRFDGRHGTLARGYDHKYVYSHFGFNLKATDLQAAVGCAQIEKLPAFTEARKRNHARLRAALSPVRDRLILPQAAPRSDPSWFGFAMTCRAGVDRTAVVKSLERDGIQTRMLFAGNIVRHPCFDRMRAKGEGYRTVGDLRVTDRVMADTFWVGVYPGMSVAKLDYMAERICEAVS
jgi:CDP-6-deoxy-D-xylo-4-hexulose-3-dehydrase